MNHLAGFDGRDGLEQVREDRPIANDLVPGHMGDDDSERQ